MHLHNTRVFLQGVEAIHSICLTDDPGCTVHVRVYDWQVVSCSITSVCQISYWNVTQLCKLISSNVK